MVQSRTLRRMLLITGATVVTAGSFLLAQSPGLAAKVHRPLGLVFVLLALAVLLVPRKGAPRWVPVLLCAACVLGAAALLGLGPPLVVSVLIGAAAVLVALLGSTSSRA